MLLWRERLAFPYIAVRSAGIGKRRRREPAEHVFRRRATGRCPPVFNVSRI